MPDKMWTATDVVLGKLTIHQITDEEGQPAIQLERRYKFLDAQGNVLDQIAGGRVLEILPIVEVPVNILSALQKIDAWTKAKALGKEGML